MRGAMHHKGEVAFTVLPGQGVVVLPMSRRHVAPSSSDKRVTSGNPGLDAMTQGGLRAGSSTLVSGATGTGKTLLASEFITAGAAHGEQVLLLAYEESREQIQRNSTGWAMTSSASSGPGCCTSWRARRRWPVLTTILSRFSISFAISDRRGSPSTA